MGVEFTVSCESLDSMVSRLDQVVNDLNGASTPTDWGNHSGFPRVDDELRHFYAHWTDGMYRLSREVGELRKLLGEAADAYRTTENEITSAAAAS